MQRNLIGDAYFISVDIKLLVVMLQNVNKNYNVWTPLKLTERIQSIEIRENKYLYINQNDYLKKYKFRFEGLRVQTQKCNKHIKGQKLSLPQFSCI